MVEQEAVLASCPAGNERLALWQACPSFVCRWICAHVLVGSPCVAQFPAARTLERCRRHGAARAPRPALGSPVRRGLRRSEKKLGGKFAPSGRCALCSASDQVDLLRRRLEEKQRKYAHRTGQRIFLPAVTWGFSLRCSSSRRTSTQAKKTREAGGGQRGQREPRRTQR